MIVYASEATNLAQHYVGLLNGVIFFPLILLLTAIATVYFLYGSFEFVMGANNEQAREKGKKHILWGLIGLLVMLSAWAILTLVLTTFNIDTPRQIGTSSPFAPSASPIPVARPAAVRGDDVPVPVSRPAASPTPVPEDSIEILDEFDLVTEEVTADLAERGFSESDIALSLNVILDTNRSADTRLDYIDNLLILERISEQTHSNLEEFIFSY